MLRKTYKGKKSEGPSVLLIGGVHGNEMTPVYTLSHMIKKDSFYLESIKELTILNGVNVTGLREGTREMQFDGSNDLNRSLVNDPELDINLIQLLEEEIEKHDIIIDVHSSPSCSNFALINIDEFANSINEYCDKAGVITGFRYSGANTIKNYCTSKDKIGITLEINKMNEIDFESATDAVDQITNLLVFADEAKLYKEEPWMSPLEEIRTYKEGIVEVVAKNNQRLSRNDTICKILDLELNEVLEIKAPKDCVVITSPNRNYAKRGELLYYVQSYD